MGAQAAGGGAGGSADDAEGAAALRRGVRRRRDRAPRAARLAVVSHLLYQAQRGSSTASPSSPRAARSPRRARRTDAAWAINTARARAARAPSPPKTRARAQLVTPWALNTDGIDASGVDIDVRDVHVRNADDAVCVKPSGGAAEDRFACTERVRVSNATLVGVGASIGSVVPTDGAPACVRGVAFSRVAMPGTLKGIHVKTDEGDGGARASAVVEDVLFEDVTVDDAAWWAVWLGPQQEEDVNKRTACRFSYPRRRPAANDCLAARGVALRT